MEPPCDLWGTVNQQHNRTLSDVEMKLTVLQRTDERCGGWWGFQYRRTIEQKFRDCFWNNVSGECARSRTFSGKS